MRPSLPDALPLHAQHGGMPESALTEAGLCVIADADLALAGPGVLERCLAAPGHGLLVAESAAQAPGLKTVAVEAAKGGGLALLLSAGSAWSLDVAQVFADAVCDRWPALVCRHNVIRLATHEALVNAVAHGCFRLPPDLRDRSNGWLEHTAAVNQALTDPTRALRPVLVTAQSVDEDDGGWRIQVADDGPGFDPATVTGAGASLPRGRGLRLIRAAVNSLAWEDNGRRVVMTVKERPA